MRTRPNLAGTFLTIGTVLPITVFASLPPLYVATHTATCLNAVDRLATEHGLAIDPPDARAGGVPTDRLSQSQGIIDPPAVDDAAVFQPPRNQVSRMETAPDIKRDATRKRATSSLGAGERLRLESILVAAREFAEAGNERSCRERLREAREIVDGNETR